MLSRHGRLPQRRIQATTPVRICDNGGWTDTWFAEYGRVFNIAVTPGVSVTIDVFERDAGPPVIIDARNFGQRYAFEPQIGAWLHHPLLEAAIVKLGVPAGVALTVTVASDVPAGAATGTSAAVAVALIGALDYLTPDRLSAHEVAYAAHAVEVDMLGQQSGIQDQLSAAHGGVNFIEMTDYPQATVNPLPLTAAFRQRLEASLLLVFLGKPHHSSRLHEMVIQELEGAGPHNPKLAALRRWADESRSAVLAGDLEALGHCMRGNTESQRDLHPALVGPHAQHIIDLARQHQALGWKVNGAGGNGGSITLLTAGADHRRSALEKALLAHGYQPIPTQLSPHGLTIH